ncbi:hypothetical protein FKM82_029947 [Ascaphus truei]
MYAQFSSERSCRVLLLFPVTCKFRINVTNVRKQELVSEIPDNTLLGFCNGGRVPVSVPNVSVTWHKLCVTIHIISSAKYLITAGLLYYLNALIPQTCNRDLLQGT